MNPKQIQTLYNLSPTQQGMLFHTLYAPQTGVYHIQFPYHLQGDLHIPCFQEACHQLLTRHDTLRTTFHWEDLSNPLQLVHKTVSLPLKQQDWQHLSASEQEAQLEELLLTDRQQGFDLTQAPLLRFYLIQTAVTHFHFIASIHHILIDGWSWSLLFKELFTLYGGLLRQQPVQFPPPRPYRDYISWLQNQDIAQAESFWQDNLAGFTTPTPLPAAKSPQQLIPNPNAHFQEQAYRLSPEQTTRLQTTAQQQQVSLNTLCQAAWSLLLSRYTGQNDILFGITTAGRPPALDGSDTMVGLFINTLPLRVICPPQETVSDFLKKLQSHQGHLQQFEYSPLAQVHTWSDLPAGTPLFESILVFENYRQSQSSTKQRDVLQLSITSSQSVERTNYPLTLIILPGASLTLKLIYECERFTDDTIDRLLTHLQTLLLGIAQSPHQRLSQLPLLTPTETAQLLHEWNHTAVAYPHHQCLHTLIEAQASQTPDAIALTAGATHLTYTQLNTQANQLAHHLLTLGLKPEEVVAISLERTPQMVIALLAILKAGATLLPLDPTFPKERLTFMLTDAAAKHLITTTSQRTIDDEQLTSDNLTTIYLDSHQQTIAQHPPTPPSTFVTSQNLAYIIYTSGSTGQPKGVAVPHQTVVNLLTTMQQRLALTPSDKLLAITTLSFDIAFLELLLPLTVGAQLVIAAREDTTDPATLKAQLQHHAITHMQATPITWQLLLTNDWQGQHPHTLLCGGEALPPTLAHALLQKDVTLWNLYGPTETTIWSTAVSLSQPLPDQIPIGRPLANTQLYLLDNHLRPVPIGVPSHLYIGGHGLARGYLNQPALTAERFIPNPFPTPESTPTATYTSRLYKTGDLACYLPDGNIQFLGRSDFQVKIRGFRIELGEIEAALSHHHDIRQAVVVAHANDEGTHHTLAAYLITATDPAPSTSDLHTYLQTKLPTYMIPNHFIFLEQFPLTTNGKINRRALPHPDQSRPDLAASFQAPQTPLEQQIIAIWENILKVTPIGLNDNFFELGGNSLLAIRLLDQLENGTGQKMTLPTLFENPTPQHLADLIQGRSWPHVLKYVGDIPALKSPLVTIKTSGSKPPIFIVAALNGVTPSNAILGLMDMGLATEPERPFYALQPEPMAADALALFMASGDDPALLFSGEAPIWQPDPDTIKETAIDCIRAIKTVQSEGPYHIGGFCSGGIVAFEMAQLLHAHGETVSTLLLIDTESPAFMAEQKTVDGVSTNLDQIHSMAWFVARDLAGAAYAPMDYEELAATLAHLPAPERWPYALDRLKAANAVDAETEYHEIRRLYMIYRVNLWTIGAVLTSYQPDTIYPGVITLFRAREVYTEVKDQTLGWHHFTTQPVDLEFIPGDHGTIFLPENLTLFMEKLTPYLEKGDS